MWGGSPEAVSTLSLLSRKFCNDAYFLPEAKPLECASLLGAFVECSIYPLNSDQMRHYGGSKLSKAPSATKGRSEF
jgi:hypothetical protein